MRRHSIRLLLAANAIAGLAFIILSVSTAGFLAEPSEHTSMSEEDDPLVVVEQQEEIRETFINQIIYDPPGISDLYENLRFESNPAGFSFIGTASSVILSPATSVALELSISELEEYGNRVGFVMIDITNGQGIAYNADEQFYSASTIKGHYVASLVYQQPEMLDYYYYSIAAILWYSDNDAYQDLYDATNWSESIAQWYLEADTVLDDYNHCYPYICARDMARLWLRNYEFFSSDSEVAQELAGLYTTPNRSPINAVLGGIYTTYTKAGWEYETGILEDGSRYAAVANDAGIVFAGENGSQPFIIAIMSDLDGDLESLEDLVFVLNQAHDELAAADIATLLGVADS